MDMENKVRQIRELVEAKREKFARVSDEVWAVPELYFHETKSAAILIKALKEEGFEVQEGVDGIPHSVYRNLGQRQAGHRYPG